MIEIQNLSFSYKKQPILDNVSFRIPKGSCTGIIGANGCGKSTLLSILAGSRRAAGNLIVTEKEMSYSLKKSLRPDFIGYVPQENPLLEDVSGFDNLFLWYKKGKKEFQDMLSSPLIGMLDITSYLQKPVRSLSGGMKKRLSISIAFINQPTLLILDEPSAALDIPCKYAIQEYLLEYLRQGGTILISTHETEELSLCQNLLALKNGKLQEIDTGLSTEELIKHL